MSQHIFYITYDGLLDAVAQSQVLPYLKKFAREGLKLTVLSFEKKEKSNKKEVYNLYKEELAELNISWITLKYHKSPVIPATIFDILQGFLFGLCNIVTKKRCVIHTRGYIATLIGIFLRYVTGKKLIFDMRGFWPDEKVDAGYWKKNGLLYLALKKIENQLIRRSDEVIVLTKSAKKYIQDIYQGASLTVIPSCVDTNLLKLDTSNILPKETKGRFVIIYFGSLGTFYNLEEMVNFFKIFKKKRPDAFFWLVINYLSSSKYLSFLKSNIDDLDYTISSLSYKDVPCGLSNSDISIVFYRRHLSKIGCSPIKFAESLSCGLPIVINSGIGDTEEIVRKERIGIVVNEFSTTAYQNSAQDLLELLSEGDALKQRCRNVAEKYFSLNYGVEKYQTVYQKLFKA